MKARLTLLLAAVAMALSATGLSAATLPAPFRVTVDLAAPHTPISPDLFGIFFEDLNYAADGGLYAELIQNRSFGHPDMIYFNATEVFPSLNYAVHRLFGHHAGEAYLSTTLTPAADAKLAASTVRDSRSGDVIVKVVNGESHRAADGDPLRRRHLVACHRAAHRFRR